MSSPSRVISNATFGESFLEKSTNITGDNTNIASNNEYVSLDKKTNLMIFEAIKVIVLTIVFIVFIIGLYFVYLSYKRGDRIYIRRNQTTINEPIKNEFNIQNVPIGTPIENIRSARAVETTNGRIQLVQ
jgi:hypothetical protein